MNSPQSAGTKETPCQCSMSDTFGDYYCEKQAWKCCKYADLETRLRAAEKENLELKHDIERQGRIAGEAQRELAEAERLILAAVEMMTPEQVGNWTGVRAWLERSGGQGRGHE